MISNILQDASLEESTEITKKAKKKKKAAYSKAVETMYRNSYRAQLDLISLAATKANIMISLNGFIVSILMVSGSFIFVNDPGFLVPAVIFLLTSASSIYFALSSASPEAPVKRRSLLKCLVAYFTGKVSLKEFNDYREAPKDVFDRQNSNILIFEDYAKVSKKVYLECMDELINDPDKLYAKMSDQLYYLGKVADKKYTTLRYSYSIFRWGLILSIIVFLVIKSLHLLFPHTSVASSDIIVNSGIKTFDKIYEPSGVQSLLDGRLVVIEDEASQALHVLDIKQDGSFKENKRLTQKLMKSFNTKLNDLEGVTLGPDGYIYAITSHQRNLSGERSSDREQLIRFKIEGNRIIDVGSYGKLTDDIEQSGILGEVDEQGNGGIVNINIESLCFDREGNLLIGFRAPLNSEKTIVGVLENPTDIFEYKAKPIISPQPLLLDLFGGGIRAMSYDRILRGYLISNEIYGINNNKKKVSQILFWDGEKTHRTHRMAQPGLKNIEGITSVRYGDNTRILLSSDDGKKAKEKTASYLFLKYIELSDK
ncbi:MAG: hypothetical protein HOM14_10030 [Gammaproteobacteria bacterium]|jgi:hypothetical protein|nr:hypothetical protein [Gammaproteobacteria bacterium]MBT3724557.1 hypothetical protein [Gammaproteobacteria bacterium]MBT4076842.1 hypothetical protein [Gammaproteobacteria bacterium]MBT4193154.1 hypothetical protein [Gammaproteobacteria bacterium]MBT4450289.1 hypothetical protein [Gammaproteobacteria bacterium]